MSSTVSTEGATPIAIRPPSLLVTIVVWRPDLTWLTTTMRSLGAAIRYAQEAGSLGNTEVMLVDNEGAGATSLHAPLLHTMFGTRSAALHASTLCGHGNVGYGKANNLAARSAAASDFLLVLNPDVDLAVDVLHQTLAWIAGDANTVLVSPCATEVDGRNFPLVRGYPNVLALLVRGFLPHPFRRWFRPTLNRYDRAEVPPNTMITDARIVSGCFMLMRRDAFQCCGGFDPAFFLYFEDFDLSWRLTAPSTGQRAVRLPTARIVHGGGQAARKGLRHISLFVRSAARFFHKHGWRWW